MSKIYNVGIIGGGVSGVVTALQLDKYKVDSILFEKESSVVNGPPFCHLHAGGNLYPDISDEQCKMLMKQSIEMARMFPQAIDKRPTLIGIPQREKIEAGDIERRLEMLVEYYKGLIDEDSENEILGSPNNYYKVYYEEDLRALEKKPMVKSPQLADEWMTNAAKCIDYQQLKMPIVLVNEHGWNLFRFGAHAQLALTRSEWCDLKLNSHVVDIKDVRGQNLPYNWEIETNEHLYKVKYLVNSCGYRSARIDDLLDLNAERLIEFKAAYVSQWQSIAGLIPEFIFHGERGTPHGMVQLTPYSQNHYQIHAMTTDVTLFENGLIKLSGKEKITEFEDDIRTKLQCGWKEENINVRTQQAIALVAKFVPSFSSASVAGPPLYGAQQIPGNDPSLRVGEVSFPSKFYARSEIVKASSALTVANQILNKIKEEQVVVTIPLKNGQHTLLESVSKSEINNLASQFAIQRQYPAALSQLVVSGD